MLFGVWWARSLRNKFGNRLAFHELFILRRCELSESFEAFVIYIMQAFQSISECRKLSSYSESQVLINPTLLHSELGGV